MIGAVLARIGALPAESWERLTSREQQLAALGIGWVTDPAYDTELAQELARRRLRRQANVLIATPVHQAVPQPSISAGLRRFVGVLLIRLGRRVQGGQPVRTTV